MKKEILSEIYRIQEIMGQKKIIKETKFPLDDFIKLIANQTDTQLTKAVKSELADFASQSSKNIDDAYNELIGELKLASGADEIETVINKYFPSDIGESGITKILDNVLTSTPEVYTKIALESNFGNRLKAFEKIINSKTVPLDVAQREFDILKKRVDELLTSDDETLVQMGTKIKESETYVKLEAKVEELKNKEAVNAAKADATKQAIDTEKQVDEIINYLKTNADTQQKVKKLIKDGKYGDFKSRLNKLEELLEDESSLKAYLGETKYEKFKSELGDFQRQQVNILSRFGIKAGPWLKNLTWKKVLILFAAVCFLDGIFNFTELGIGPTIGDLLSTMSVGFKRENSDSEESKSISSSEKTLDDFKKYIKEKWNNQAPSNDESYIEVEKGKVYKVKDNGDNYIYDVQNGNFIYRKP